MSATHSIDLDPVIAQRIADDLNGRVGYPQSRCYLVVRADGAIDKPLYLAAHVRPIEGARMLMVPDESFRWTADQVIRRFREVPTGLAQ